VGGGACLTVVESVQCAFARSEVVGCGCENELMSEVVRARLCGWEVSDGAGVGMKLRTGWSSPHERNGRSVIVM